MKNLKVLLKYLAPYKWSAFRNIFYNLLGALFALFTFTLAVPFLNILFGRVGAITDPGPFHLSTRYLVAFGKFYLSNFVAQHGQANSLILIVIVVIFASLFKNGFIFLAYSSMAYIRSSTVRDIRQNMYNKLLRLPLSYFTEARKGDVMTRISNDVQEIEVSVMASLNIFFKDPIAIIIYVVYLFVSSYKLTLFALVLLPVSGWLIGRASRTLRSSAFTSQQYLGRLLSVVEETLTGLRIVKGFNAEEKMKVQFGETNTIYSKIFKRVIRKASLATPLSEFLGTIVVMILMFVGGNLALQGSDSLTPDKLIAYLIVFSQILPPAKSITTGWYAIQKGMASIDRVDMILNAEEKVAEKTDAREIRNFNDSIEFRDVWFGYNNESVLRDINLTVRKGQTVAIVGKSGAGKSTLADLLPRFMDVDKGGIFIDNTEIRDLKVKDLRSLMGIVSQQPLLFNTSFRQNIAFGVDQYDMDQVEHAARIANAHEFISETEEGYDYLVGEGGTKLSGGQRQRISIARAIMANPPILILDEATSALDTESERLVQDAIIKLMKSRTSIVIAHRLSTIMHADLIVVMDEGKIIESGTHAELMERPDGFYKKLHSFQAI
jgi:ATP-binding cassette, subfamily B, bacterial MsbA